MAQFQQNPPATPSVDEGARHVAITTAQRIIPNIKDTILFKEPNKTPLMAFVKGLRGKEMTDNRLFGWLYKDEKPRMSAVADATVTAAGTTLNVTTGEGERFKANDTVLNTVTREVFRVASVSTDALTIVRLANATTMTEGQKLQIIGSGFAENAAKGTIKSIAETYDYNYCQIVRTSFGWSRRQKYSGLYGGPDTKTEKGWVSTEHAKDLEYIALFGRRYKTTVSNYELTYSGGLEEFASYNVWDLNGERPSMLDFTKVLEKAMAYGKGGFQFGSATKYLLASPAWCTLFEEWWHDKIRYTTDTKGLGLKMGFVETAHGKVVIMPHYLLVGDHAGYAFLVDFNHMKYKYYKNSDTMLRENIETPGTDGEEHEFLTDFGLQIENPWAHTVFKGLGGV